MVHSTCRGGVHGHIALMMNMADHLELAGIAFNAPVHPKAAPIHVAGA